MNGACPPILVPGHERVGVVTEVGRKVKKCQKGNKAGVGSCRSCESCSANYCPKMVLTYAAPDKDGSITYGGYSNEMVCNEHFVIRFPENMPLLEQLSIVR
ncbi:hypothetical protein ACH5RR_012137 [Cinchona calisaya]|uniref:Alcohol dehydrogenase-like N-terminal domain-containing protein n=1 Tax=Cinchona calisaya TaxID=153742 RepID=A0ABD3A6W5_9GENT